MGLDDRLTILVRDAYAAALDDARWPGWSERLAEAVGGTASAFGVIDRDTGAVSHRHLGRFSARACEEYGAGMAAYDPQTLFLSGCDRSAVYVDSDYVDRGDPATAEYMRWQESIAGVRSSLGAVVILGDGRLKVGLVAHRRRGDGATPARERTKLAAMLPQIIAAMDLGFRHTAKLRECYWDGVLAQGAEPAALVDDMGRLLRVTPDLERLFARRDGLSGHERRLRALATADDAALQAAIGRAAAPDGIAGAVRVSRRSGRPAYLLTVYPLPWRRSLLAPAEGGDRPGDGDRSGAARRASATLYAAAFALSPREAELAVLLMHGHSIESAAAALGIAAGTARVHLRAVFAKTRTGRQSELVHLLARIDRAGA